MRPYIVGRTILLVVTVVEHERVELREIALVHVAPREREPLQALRLGVAAHVEFESKV